MTKKIIVGLICVSALLGLSVYFKPLPAGYIYFMSLNDGDSILIEELSSRKTCLIDIGSPEDAQKITRFLSARGIKKIDYLVFTHSHPDHIGSITQLFRHLPIGNIYDNGAEVFSQPENSALSGDYLRLVRGSKNYRVLNKPDKFKIGKFDFEALWPPKPLASGSPNANSLVLMLRYKGFSCLFPGDIDAQVETRLLEDNPKLKARILKIAHHGADTASSDDFIKSVGAQIAIASVGRENKYKYPSESVIKRINRLGLELFRTDLDADILVTIYNYGNYTVKSKI